jgi:hypothetical protein
LAERSIDLYFPVSIVKKCLSVIAILAAATAIGTATPATAGQSARKNYVGPTITLVNGLTGFGANSRFGISENASVRPFAVFFSSGNESATVLGADLTYDYTFPQTDWTIYGGLGLASAGTSNGGAASGFRLSVGTEYRMSDSLVLNANANFGYLTIGAGFNF